MSLDVISYSRGSKVAAAAMSGVDSMSVEGTTLNIKTKNGEELKMVFPTPKDGVDGVNGKDGINGNDGEPGKDGINGKDGKDGADGYTPVKGVDYWTDEDKAEIKQYIDTELLGGES